MTKGISPVSFWVMFLIAVGVSADAFAVALGKGLHMRRLSYGRAAAIAVTFGVFQALMPLLGWLLASSFAGSIRAFDHWIAFLLLGGIGARMIWEAVRGGDNDDEDDDELRVRELLVLGVATSIDALVVGVGLAFLDVSIVPVVILIGVVTLLFSFVGVVIGRRVGRRFGPAAEIAGGLLLIALGVKILLEHLGAS